MNVKQHINGHVTLVAAISSVLSLLLVFSAATGQIPADLLPRAPDRFLNFIPHLNAAISIVAISTISYGWITIKRGDIQSHRRAMLASLGLFGLFLTLYLYRLSVVGGATTFPGPTTIYRFVYLPILGLHVSLAVVCIPLLFYVSLLAYSKPTEELGETNHPKIGKIVVPLWITSFGLGIVVFSLLYSYY